MMMSKIAKGFTWRLEDILKVKHLDFSCKIEFRDLGTKIAFKNYLTCCKMLWIYECLNIFSMKPSGKHALK